MKYSLAHTSGGQMYAPLFLAIVAAASSTFYLLNYILKALMAFHSGCFFFIDLDLLLLKYRSRQLRLRLDTFCYQFCFLTSFIISPEEHESALTASFIQTLIHVCPQLFTATRTKWTPMELEELERYAGKFLKRKITPSRKECRKFIDSSKKNGGDLAKRSPELIVKKISAMNVKARKAD